MEDTTHRPQSVSYLFRKPLGHEHLYKLSQGIEFLWNVAVVQRHWFQHAGRPNSIPVVERSMLYTLPACQEQLDILVQQG